MPYSVDLRDRAVNAVHNGMQKTKVCKIFNICRQTLYSWLALEQSQGNLQPQVGFQKGHSHGIKNLEAFRKFVESYLDYTQEEMAKHFGVGSSTIGRTLNKIGFTRKKRAKPIRKEVKKQDKIIVMP